MKKFLSEHWDSMAVFAVSYLWVVTAYIQIIRI